MKKQNGITLVALVITIIVLLILAGVSISLALGNNGVLTRASSAVTANEVGTIKQELGLTIQDAEGAYYEAWSTNAQAKKSDFYTTGDSGVFAHNCSGTVTGVTKTASSNTGEVEGYYKSSSETVYYFKINVGTGKLETLVRIPSTATKADADDTAHGIVAGQYVSNNAPVKTGDEV